MDRSSRHALSSQHASCRHRWSRVRWTDRRAEAQQRSGSHHHHRSAQPSFIPAAALPSRDGSPRDFGNRLADPLLDAQTRGGDHAAGCGHRGRSAKSLGRAGRWRRRRLRYLGPGHRVLLSLERAERESDPARRAALLTFVIVGGGPTGVELAGAIVELVYQNLHGEFRRFDTRQARVLLIEAGPRLLPAFAPDLSAYALQALAGLGVEVRLGSPVTDCNSGGVGIGDQFIEADVVLWAAGVRASPAAAWLDVPADSAGRVKVEPDLTVPGHPQIFVIGDTATVNVWNGKPAPGIAPAAKQQGAHVARTIRQRLAGNSQPRTFRYRHAGDLATIGKRSAVIDFGWCKLKGWVAWWVWGLAHIYFLIGLRNRFAVALSWLWIYLTGNRSACLITQVDHNPKSP